MAWCSYCKDGSTFLSTRYYCTVSGKDQLIPESYYDYCRHDYKATLCPFYNEYGPSSSGCFITTVVCDILKNKDDSDILNTLRKFRDEVLKSDDKYNEILKIYDSIGPVLAYKLQSSDNNIELAKEIYDNSLKPISDLVKEGLNDRAVKHYLYLTLYLVNSFGYKDVYNGLYDNNFGYLDDFDEQEAGHGNHPLGVHKILKKA